MNLPTASLNQPSFVPDWVRDEFEKFRVDPYDRMMVKVRRLRARQIRELLSDPKNIELDKFNSEVWNIETRTTWPGGDINLNRALTERTLDAEQLSALEQAVNEEQIQVHGNFVWNNGSTVYAPKIQSDDEKLRLLRERLEALRDNTIPPLEIARRLEMVPGFGPNNATGLVMLFFPDEFAIYNAESKAAIERLGLPAGSLEAFEGSAQQLKSFLNAQDFIELDWFLYGVNREPLPDVPSIHNENAATLPSWRERIRTVLAQANEPLHEADIQARIEEAGQSSGQTPGRTINYELNKPSNPPLFDRVSPGVYALRDEATNGDGMTAQRIVKIAPGNDAKYWEECRDKGYICVGWDELGDLSRFASKAEFLAGTDEIFKSLYSAKAKRTEKANEVWTLRELRPGDIVVANKGTSEVVGIGDVVEPGYAWRPEREEFNHTVAVQWRSIDTREIPTQKNWAFKTIAPVSQQLFRSIEAGVSAEPGRHVWLFQANVKHFNVQEQLALKQVGDEDEWSVTSYKDEMRPGDIVLLWQSGPDAGIYAAGEITGNPQLREVELGTAPWLRRMGNEEQTAWWVPFRLTHILESPLLRSLPATAHDSKQPTLIGHPILKNLHVIRYPQGTNYKITSQEWKALKSLLGWETLTNYWWVNQGRNYDWEHRSGTLYATKQSDNGRVFTHHSNMMRLIPGDRIVHYAGGEVRALGTVLETAQEVPPEGDGSEEAGYRAHVRYDELSQGVPLESIPSEMRTLGSDAADGGPFTRQGTVKQGYLFGISSELFASIEELAGRIPSRAVDSEWVMPSFDHIRADVEKAGLRLDEATLRRYHLSLQTRGFVILSGQSGTGKTWLSQLYAHAIGAQRQIVAVAPNWTTNEDLLGYYNPLSKSYQETEFGEFVRAAGNEYERARLANETPRPYHLVLDEMNLARVEYYFAKFLSALEVRARDGVATIDLGHDRSVTLTPNLFFIGTVNVDETTHGFADKVYDRAQLIELLAPREELLAHIADAPWREPLMQIWDAVHEVAPFAFRVLDEIRAYIEAAQKMEVSWEVALDEQILQKILPKFKGTDPRLDNALQEVLKRCEGHFPLAHRKATEMMGRYRSSGFASFF